MLSHLFKKLRTRSLTSLGARRETSSTTSRRSESSRDFGSLTSGARGFTLLEMMTVIAIITVMTGVLLGNLPNFRDSTTLQLVAQEVAITIRQAQVFGIGTKVVGSGASATFPGHGMFFCSPTSDGCRKNFLLFSDDPNESNKRYFDGDMKDSNGAYLADTATWRTKCTSTGECREVYSLGGNIDLCALQVEGADVDFASIAFHRVYPDAYIYTAVPEITPNNKSSVGLYLHSTRAKDRVRQITVYNTGSITVTNVEAANIPQSCQ